MVLARRTDGDESARCRERIEQLAPYVCGDVCERTLAELELFVLLDEQH